MRSPSPLRERTQIAGATIAVAMTLMIGVGIAFAQTAPKEPPLADGPYSLLAELQQIGANMDRVGEKLDKSASCGMTSKTCVQTKLPPPVQEVDTVPRFPDQTPPKEPEPEPTPTPQPTPQPPAPTPPPQPEPPKGFTWVNAVTGQILFGFPPSNFRYDPLGGTWFPNTDPYWAKHIDGHAPPATPECGNNCQYCRLNCQRQWDICGSGSQCLPQASSCQNACPTN